MLNLSVFFLMRIDALSKIIDIFIIKIHQMTTECDEVKGVTFNDELTENHDLNLQLNQLLLV